MATVWVVNVIFVVGTCTIKYSPYATAEPPPPDPDLEGSGRRGRPATCAVVVVIFIASSKLPGWLLWSVNSARIIQGFVSSENANDSHRESIRLLTDYMRHEHRMDSLSGQRSELGTEPRSMKGYRYMVLGEVKKLKKREAEQAIDEVEAAQAIKRLLMALKEKDKKLITLERIWNHQAHNHNGCLCGLPPGRLVLDVVTCVDQKGDAVRAFRVSEAEVAFLNDFFNSRYAIIFARGFPWLRLVLSTLLLGGISIMAVAIHEFSKIAKIKERGSVQRGVYFTWAILSLLGAKEIWEMTTYAFSDWTKVLLLCKYVEQPWWLRGRVGIVALPFVRMFLCRRPLFKRWHGKVGQFNMLFSRTYTRIPQYSFSILLSQQVKNALVGSIKKFLGESPPSLDNYLDQALAAKTGINEQVIKDAVRDLQLRDDVHRLLVWHIATCYCELQLAKTREVRVSVYSKGQSFSRRNPSNVHKMPWWRHYLVARTLSQYCCYLLKLASPLVPGNSLMAKAVFDEVYREKNRLLDIKHETFARCTSSVQILDRLIGYRSGNIVLGANEQGNTILKKGAVLGSTLAEATGDNSEALWEFLSEFWSGFVVYMAASTRASQHKMHLTTGGELMTNLWALLSHAGTLGTTLHGEQVITTVLPQPQT
uniref:DUF4220 domain-containing protein n=1 Tax=Leersia perrieri TaxID=77586 RepID=A0A0D9WEX5_9ORYZ